MEITYTLEPSDFVRFNKFWWHHKSRVKPWVIAVGLLIGLVISDLPVLGAWRGMAFSFVLPLPFICLGYWLLLPLQIRGQTKVIPGAIGLSTMAIGPRGLTRKTSAAETMVRWQSITEITEDEKQIYFFQNSRYALIIPKRAFATPGVTEEFFRLSITYWKGEVPPENAVMEAKTWPPPPQTLKLD